VFFILYEEVLRGFAKGVAAGDHGVIGEDFFSGIWPRWGRSQGVFCGGGVVFEVFDRAAPFEEERVEAVFAEFFCRPAAADAGADDDRVVLSHMVCIRCSNLVKKKQSGVMDNLIMNIKR